MKTWVAVLVAVVVLAIACTCVFIAQSFQKDAFEKSCNAETADLFSIWMSASLEIFWLMALGIKIAIFGMLFFSFAYIHTSRKLTALKRKTENS